MIHSGVQFMKNDAKTKDLRHILIIPGSGLIRTDLKKPVLQHFWAVVFDPGVTSVFTAYALKHYFDEIETIDILDCNGGDHGYPFATNFNPEINLREVSANAPIGKWSLVETELWRLNVNMTSLRLDRKICICFIMRKSNHWPKMYPV